MEKMHQYEQLDYLHISHLTINMYKHFIAPLWSVVVTCAMEFSYIKKKRPEA